MIQRGLKAAVAITFLSGIAPSFAAAPQPAGRCLRYDELEVLNMSTDTSGVAMNTRRVAYMVTFRNGCQAKSLGSFFVLDRNLLGECVSRGDLFRISGNAPPCTVEDVVPLTAVPVSGR
jgi:hypothetical protein